LKLHTYLRSDGTFDYERYRDVQIAGNRRKLGTQWADENSIRWLSEFILRRMPDPQFGICHGTRRGLEQAWFSKYCSCAVIGTEISDTSTRFPNTVQWDFHDENPEWVGKADFVYSNSWDHSYNPQLSLTVWMRQLSPRGLLFLAHTGGHRHVTELDPFGIELDDLPQFLNSIGGSDFVADQVIRDSPPIYRWKTKESTPVNYIIVRRAESGFTDPGRNPTFSAEH
jgi:hypothetical protein